MLEQSSMRGQLHFYLTPGVLAQLTALGLIRRGERVAQGALVGVEMTCVPPFLLSNRLALIFQYRVAPFLEHVVTSRPSLAGSVRLLL